MVLHVKEQVSMTKSQFTESQLIGILSAQQTARSVADICREHGLSQPPFYPFPVHEQVRRHGRGARQETPREGSATRPRQAHGGRAAPADSRAEGGDRKKRLGPPKSGNWCRMPRPETASAFGRPCPCFPSRHRGIPTPPHPRMLPPSRRSRPAWHRCT